MNSQDNADDLLKHIRHEAEEAILNQNGGSGGADAPPWAGDWPPLPGGDFPAPPPLPALAAYSSPDPVPLAEAATLVPRAKEKLTVSPGIPGFLRPMFRNQGGFNGILLRTCGRLVEASQQLQEENVQLRARLDALTDYLAAQNVWLADLARSHTESLRSLQENLERQFARAKKHAEETAGQCVRTEIRLERAEGLLAGVKAGADEQGDALARLDTQFEQQQAWIQDMQAFADEQTASLAQQEEPHLSHSRESLAASQTDAAGICSI